MICSGRDVDGFWSLFCEGFHGFSSVTSSEERFGTWGKWRKTLAARPPGKSYRCNYGVFGSITTETCLRQSGSKQWVSVGLFSWYHEFFPQIAGSYRDSYFSMTGLLIPEIAKWSWCFPSWFPFWAALVCRCRLVSQAWSPFMISIRGCSWLPLPPSLPSLSPFLIFILGCSWLPLLPCLPSLSPFIIPLLGCSWLPPAAAFSSKLVSLPDFPFGLLLAAAAALSPSLFPFLISLLNCSWLPLPPYLLACFPSWFRCPRNQW